jgi:uncharacterized membrane protein YkoI
MFSVVRPLLFAVLVAVTVLPAAAGSQAAGARLNDDAVTVAQDDGGRWRGRGPFGGPRNAGPEQLAPLEMILGNVAARFPGRHLGVDGPFQREGRWIYRIKWLTPDGRVLIVFADAQTGQVLGHRG